MNKKTLGIILVVAVVVVAGVVYLVYQGGSENGAGGTGSENLPGEEAVPSGGKNIGTGILQGGEQASEETGGQTTGGDIDKMNDEVYVEIMAQTGYYAQKHATDPIGYISYMKALYEKYGITAEGFQAYAQELEKNPDHFAYLNAKYAQRLQELQAAGE